MLDKKAVLHHYSAFHVCILNKALAQQTYLFVYTDYFQYGMVYAELRL